MTRDLENVRRLAGKLRENLVKWGHDPGIDPVHDTRTGTRRLQATLEDQLRHLPPGDAGEPVREAATAAMKLLKKIRHAAGPVRDLDVHRKLLEKLTKKALNPEPQPLAQESSGSQLLDPAAADNFPESSDAESPESALAREAHDLDAWLRHRRSHLAEDLKSEAGDMVDKLDKRLADLETALRAKTPRRAWKKPPGVVALDSFARLASEMQMLDASNLHDFRKGAKKARYVAELAAQGDAQAKQIAETLKKLQDEIGDWHDWLVLAEEAHTALGDQAAELTALIEAERERHFVAAMKTASKLRGRLMGEWLAVSRRPAARAGTTLRQRVAGLRRPTPP